MQYHEITPDMTIGDLVKSGVYGDFANFIFTDMTPDHWNCPLRDYGFDKVGFVPTLHRMEELAASGKKYVYASGTKPNHIFYIFRILRQICHTPSSSRVAVLTGSGA